MIKGISRKKFFLARSLRLSIIFLILLSVVFTGFFVYLAEKLSGKIEPAILFSILPLLFVILAVVSIVIIITLFFSHRLLGPFDRLKKEMELIKSGDYQRRLRLRSKDDKDLQSLITEINSGLDEFEKIHSSREKLLNELDSELSALLSSDEEKDALKEKQSQAFLSLHEKVRSLIGEKRG
ncbi:MAG: hypothetical protein V3R54_07800 [Thermodesulfovibrionia bacterium]